MAKKPKPLYTRLRACRVKLSKKRNHSTPACTSVEWFRNNCITNTISMAYAKKNKAERRLEMSLAARFKEEAAFGGVFKPPAVGRLLIFGASFITSLDDGGGSAISANHHHRQSRNRWWRKRVLPQLPPSPWPPPSVQKKTTTGSVLLFSKVFTRMGAKML